MVDSGGFFFDVLTVVTCAPSLTSTSTNNITMSGDVEGMWMNVGWLLVLGFVFNREEGRLIPSQNGLGLKDGKIYSTTCKQN